MDKQTLNNKIASMFKKARALCKQGEFKLAYAKAEEAEKLIESHLTEYPQDTEMWLKLALVEDSTLIGEDYLKAIECVKKILAYDPNNTYAAVLLALFLNINMIVNDECYNILCAIKTNDNEFKAMIEFGKSLYYVHRDTEKRFEHRRKASIFWHKHVKELLSKYSCDDYKRILDERIRANLQTICKYPEEPYDPLSVEQLLNEFIRSEIQ